MIYRTFLILLLSLSFLNGASSNGDKEIESLAGKAVNILGEPLFNLNFKTIDLVMEDLIKNKQVAAIKIEDQLLNDKTVYTAYKHENKLIKGRIDKNDKLPQNIVKNFKLIEKEIYHENEKIGTLKVYYKKSLMKKANIQGELQESMVQLSQKEKEWIKLHPKIVVGGEMDWAPFDFVENGIYKGISNDYLKVISQKTGLRFEVKTGMKWSELIDSIKNKKIDMLPALYHLKEREEFVNFTPAYFKLPMYIFGKTGKKRFYNIHSLHGKKVVVVKGFEIESWLRKNHPEINIVQRADILSSLQAVRSDQADAFISTLPSTAYNLEQNFIDDISIHSILKEKKAVNLYMGVRKDWKILTNIITKAFNDIKPSTHRRIKNEWIVLLEQKEKYQPIELTKKEKEWIKKHPIIKVSNEMDWVPFDYNENGKPLGYSIDVIKLLAKKIGIEVEFISGLTWDELLQALKGKKIDLVHSAKRTEDREEYALFSRPYIQTTTKFIRHKDFPEIKDISELEGKVFAAPKGWATLEFLRKNYPKIKILETESVYDAFNAVLLGKADATSERDKIAQYVINYHGFSELKISGWFKEYDQHKAAGLHIMVRDDWNTLLKLIDKALNSLTLPEKENLERKWFGASSKKAMLKLNPKEKEWIKKNPKILIGGETDWAPFNYVDENGKFVGIVADLLELIKKRTGLEIEMFTGVTYGELHKIISEHKLDVLPTVYYEKNREKYAIFTEPYMELTDFIYVKDESNIKTLEDLYGKNLVIPEGYATIEYMKKLHPKINIITTSSILKALEMVLSGEADATIDGQIVVQYLIDKHLLSGLKGFSSKLDINYLHMMIRNDKPLLASIFTKALKSISDDEKKEILSKWVTLREEKKDKTINFSLKEKEWIKEHPVISFVADPAWAPFEFINKEGVHSGIASDFLKYISEASGIEFRMTPVKTWDEGVQKIKNRESDMYTCVKKTPEREKIMTFSKPYLKYPIVMVAKNDKDFFPDTKVLEGKKVAAVKGYAITELLKRDYPKIDLILVDNVQEALEKVSKGEVYSYVSVLPVVSYYINKGGFFDLKIAGQTEYDFPVSIAIRNDWEDTGVQIINKVLDSISQEEKESIYNKWVTITYEHKIDYTLLVYILGITITILLIVFYWLRTLSRLNKQLEEQKKLFKTIYEKSADAILLLENGKFVDCNEAAVQMLKYKTKSEFLHTLPSQLSPQYQPDGKTSMEKEKILMKKALQDGINRFEWVHTRADGEDFWVDVSLTAINLEDKDMVHVRWIDIQEQKESQEQILQAKKEAEEAKEKAIIASKSKSEFLANMSHEIRTPMNSVIGFADLLSKLIKDPVQKDYLNSIQTGGKMLLSIINDILDLSKIEAGKFEITKIPVDPKILFNEMKTIFSAKLANKNLTFEIEIDPNVPHAIIIDAVRVRQVLINLIGNAIKFTDMGAITLKVESIFTEQEKSKFDLNIIVKDTGRGIAKENQERIFGAFEQVSSDDVKHYKGTGLGLAICSKLIKLMEGEISVQSQIQKGSTFTVVLHDVRVGSVEDIQSIDDNESIEDIENTIFEPSKVLIVDDIVENRKLVKSTLDNTDISFLEAVNGQEAVDIIFSRDDIDLIFMDIRMPVMNGYEATAKIKSIEDKKDIPIVALTASTMGNDVEKIKVHKFDGYLRKPVIYKDIIGVLREFLPYKEIKDDNVLSLDISLKKDMVEHVLKALKQLEGSLRTELNDVKDKGDFSLIEELMNKVLDVGNQNSINIIEQYAKDTLQAIECFDIDKVNTMINRYDLICEKLRKFYENNKNG